MYIMTVYEEYMKKNEQKGQKNVQNIDFLSKIVYFLCGKTKKCQLVSNHTPVLYEHKLKRFGFIWHVSGNFEVIKWGDTRFYTPLFLYKLENMQKVPCLWSPKKKVSLRFRISFWPKRKLETWDSSKNAKLKMAYFFHFLALFPHGVWELGTCKNPEKAIIW